MKSVQYTGKTDIFLLVLVEIIKKKICFMVKFWNLLSSCNNGTQENQI
mgnify:CR=1 FL=1